MIKVQAFDAAGTPITTIWETDPICADGAGAGLHAQYLCDVWVGGKQLFSHLKPFQRLLPGAIDLDF